MKLNWRSISRRFLAVILVLAVLLLAVRAALPYLVQRYVNGTLNSIPGYRGQIGGVNLKLWRGAYQIQDLRLQKLSGNIPVPFFEANTVDLMIEWRELFHGALAGQITLYQPKLNYVAAPNPADAQTAIDESWQDCVTRLFPFRINRLRVFDGEIHFRNFHVTPQIDVALDDVQIEASNLRNTRGKGENLFATIDITGRPARTAILEVHLRMDPLAHNPTFDLNGKLLEFPLPRLNTYLKTYGGFEISNGQLDLFSEISAANGNITGYVKPILRNTSLKVWSGQESNPVQYVIEPLAALLSLAMKNWPHDQFATKIPVSGNFSDPRIHSWTAFFSLLKNAWVQAIPPGTDGAVDHQALAEPPKPPANKEPLQNISKR